MTTTTKTPRRALASLKLPHSVPALLNYATGLVKAMTNNPSVPTPVPTLTVVQQGINDLQAAEAQALSRVKGAVAARNEKKVALVALLEQLRAYVQSVADANVENGGSIISGAGFNLRKIPVRPPRGFAAKPGAVAGAVKLVAPSAARRASYEWQYSTDGGKTWITMPSTLQARTSLTGLQSLATVEFRYRAVTKKGEGDWSQAVSIVVK